LGVHVFSRLSKFLPTIIAVLVLAQFTGVGDRAIAASSQMPDYPWDLRRKLPGAYRAYLRVLPPPLRRLGWADRFDGTGSPVEPVELAGKQYLYSTICKPHDCADNFIAFLVEVDGSRAVILAKARETQGEIIELGHPSPAEREYLQRQFTD
jgi:hypothetical protein